ncbi:DUF5689 domain-containing protein [Aequorivita lipolytica]|uniref:DUF5689 domain-containing protein n=1 Tax=Aequorivita lipolytica TaxID=153267 RepID=A0A5C6YRR0_9FLAO|nr:DUF5689 domain-containing protein [Aequorivita lipolytica]TXD70084.1 hypothetical protein ESV24_02630 [Aequorivita lipolytica]SRX50494.1 hypothetical protein AEQU2_00967 [Aequorivita lipolytica]
MKTRNLYKLCALLFFVLIMVLSCVKDDDYDVPITEVVPPDIDQNDVIEISALRDLLEQEQTATGNPDAILTFEENDKYITGYVISNDEGGNFFEELIIQNSVSNPSAGVKVLIDVSPLFTTFEFGRKVYVKLNNLTVGIDSGVLTLGIRDGNNIEKIAESTMFVFLIRDVDVAAIEPLPINISDFTDLKTNLYIRLNDVQFNRNDAVGNNRKTFAAEPSDQFDGERTLESCVTGATAVFSTSTFADFKALLLPNGRGSLDGILTYNFFGEIFNVVVNDPSTINFDNEDRCDPSEIDCGLASSTGNNVLFSDFFETQSPGNPITGNGWTNYVEAGSETWEAYTAGGNNPSLGISARMQAFNSGDDRNIAWLITPQVNFDAQDGETLNFKTSNSFADGSTLELLFSSDWDGNPDNITSATWDLLSAAYITQDDDPFARWFPSGNVSLECITGGGYIALKYVGSGEEDFDGTYEFDEIVINSN